MSMFTALRDEGKYENYDYFAGQRGSLKIEIRFILNACSGHG